MIRKETLDNGIVVVAEKIPYVKSVSLGVWIRAGSVNETVSTNGTSHLVEHLFFKGTTSRSAKQINESLECVGGTANAFTTREYTCLYAKVLDSHLDIAVELLADILRNSTFQDLGKEKTVVEEEIQSYIDSPEDHVHDLLAENLWKNHPLGFPITGSKKALRKLTLDDVRAHYQKWYGPSNIVIAMAGNFELRKAFSRLRRYFGDINGSLEPWEYSPPQVSHSALCKYRRIGQVHLCLAVPGVAASDERRFAFSLLANILGGSSISRLFQKVREEEGLAYQISAFASSLDNAGMLGIYAAVNPDNVEKALHLIYRELDSLRRKPVPSGELTNAKEQLKGNITLGLESTSSRMMRLARSQLIFQRVESVDRILSKIDQVRSADIQRLARELFQNESLNVVALGPIRGIEEPRL